MRQYFLAVKGLRVIADFSVFGFDTAFQYRAWKMGPIETNRSSGVQVPRSGALGEDFISLRRDETQDNLIEMFHNVIPFQAAEGLRDYCDLSRKNIRSTVGTVTETWPALVTGGSATGDHEFGSERSEFFWS